MPIKTLWKGLFYMFCFSKLSINSYFFNSVIKNTAASSHGEKKPTTMNPNIKSQNYTITEKRVQDFLL